jgi:hypothetical protein
LQLLHTFQPFALNPGLLMGDCPIQPVARTPRVCGSSSANFPLSGDLTSRD